MLWGVVETVGADVDVDERGEEFLGAEFFTGATSVCGDGFFQMFDVGDEVAERAGDVDVFAAGR